MKNNKNKKSNYGKKQRIEDYKVIHRYNTDEDAPTLEQIKYSAKFLDHFLRFVKKYS